MLYSTSYTKLYIGCAFIGCVSLVNCIIIFNNDEFIIDTPFKNIKNAVTTGNMKCGLQNEDLKLHENKYNGSHIIFRYKQHCDSRSMLDYPKKEDIYFNEFMSCSLYYVISLCGGKAHYFEFNDTCAIEFNTACDERFLGPCIPSPNNSTQRVIIQLGDDTVQFSTEEIQELMGEVVICDPKTLQNVRQRFGKYFDEDYQTFRYGSQICAITRKIYGKCPIIPNLCCYPYLFNVQGKYGQKTNKEPIKKTDSFNK